MTAQFYKEVLAVIRKTRDISLPHFGSATITKKTSADGVDVVTATDQAIETFLTEEFKKIDPTILFVGEEYGGNRTSKRFWLVDPIDGTGTYIRGLPFCTTMVALVEREEVVFGAIYNFIDDILFYAEKGKGAFANETAISVSDRSLKGAYIGYESKIEKQENMQKYLEFKGQAAALKFLSSGYEYTLVASGKTEGKIMFDPYGKDYDFAPGNLLVAEAGGVVTNIGSRSYDYRNVNSIAANPIVHKELTEGPGALFPVTE